MVKVKKEEEKKESFLDMKELKVINEEQQEAIEETPQRCSTCRFYRDPNCCYNPPSWSDYTKRYEFNRTVAHQWCGKWEKRNVK